MDGHGWARLGVLGAVLALATPAAAQEGEMDPELSDPSIDRIVRDMIESPAGSASIAPRTAASARPAAPGNVEGPLVPGWGLGATGGATLLAEDTFITRRRGRLLRLGTGDWAFIFHSASEDDRLAPMIVLPCRELELAETVIEDASVGDVFELSGRIFAYRGRNYVLPNRSHGLLASPVSAEEAEETPIPTGELEPEIADIVASLEAEREAHQPLAPIRVDGADVPGSESVLKEGTFVLTRRGRMVRLETGQWAFVVDSGADGMPTLDPALVLTPCLNLQAMERLASDRGEELVIELTGRTLAYKQRAYLVPLMFQVARDEGIRPLQ